MTRTRKRATVLAATAALVAGVGVANVVSAQAASAGCQVSYSVSSQWPGGFSGNVSVTNLGDPVTSWTLKWSFTAGQQVTQAWNATVAQSGNQVTAANVSYNGALATNASASFGFNGTWTSSNPIPTSFAFNGTTCTGSVVTSTPTATQTASPTPTRSATASPTPTRTTASPTPTSTGNPPPTTGLVGWATQNGGTTGGGSGPTVTVSTLADLTTQAASTTAETIRVNGLFTCSADVKLASNKTILGAGSNSGLIGCGLNLRDINNVIIRNMNISKVPAGNGNGDAIHIDHSTNLWIDHNDLSSDTTHGTDYYDGLLDITHAADYVTVSWNKLHDHIKCSLVGHSDSNTSEDTGHLRVTYHHNWFNDCAERNPRVRFGNPVHVFNNYYNNGDYSGYNYGIASTCGAGVLVEGNYFENMTDPTHTQEGSSPSGNLVERNNVYVNSGTPQTAGTVATIPYPYTMDPAANVKPIVTAGAGTGKI